jgi:hypothetical protein
MEAFDRLTAVALGKAYPLGGYEATGWHTPPPEVLEQLRISRLPITSPSSAKSWACLLQ